MLKFILKDPADLAEQIAPWLDQLSGQEIILLTGQTGAGKTTFVQACLSHWGYRGAVSPTFSFHHRFDLNERTVDHFDLYRLASLGEVESIGFWDLLNESSLVFIEWPHLIPREMWPLQRKVIEVSIKVLAQEFREISIL